MSVELIAEIGWNHMGDMQLAKRMIVEAKNSGADYAKFQTWQVKNLKPGAWDKDGRREIYTKAELSDSDHFKLRDMCNKVGIKFLTSCFCEADLAFVSQVTDEIKIPSTECTNEKLVKSAISMFKRVFISTGASEQKEYSRWNQWNIDNVWLLHCVSSYPCSADKVNMPKLRTIAKYTDRYGYSGHYEGIWDAVAAISMGAKVVEKHFTVDRNLPGRDNKFAILPDQMRQIREYADEFALMNNNHGSGYQDCEKDQRENYARRWG